METLLVRGIVVAVAANPTDYTAADDDDWCDDGTDCAAYGHRIHHDDDDGDAVAHCSMSCDHTTVVAAVDDYYRCCWMHDAAGVAAVADQRQ